MHFDEFTNSGLADVNRAARSVQTNISSVNADVPGPTEDLADTYFEVEDILTHRKLNPDGNTYVYRVKWRDYDSSNNSWEPEESFVDSPGAKALLEAYKRQYPNTFLPASMTGRKSSRTRKPTRRS